ARPPPGRPASKGRAGGARRRRRGRRRSTFVRTDWATGSRVYCCLHLAHMELRALPSVDELARDERLAGEPQTLAVEAARAALARAREAIGAGHDPGDLGRRAVPELGAP